MCPVGGKWRRGKAQRGIFMIDNVRQSPCLPLRYSVPIRPALLILLAAAERAPSHEVCVGRGVTAVVAVVRNTVTRLVISSLPFPVNTSDKGQLPPAASIPPIFITLAVLRGKSVLNGLVYT